MIRFSSVTKKFGDHPPALLDVSFEIEPGELVVVTGPSGSGKTSLMRLLTKEYLPSEGEITFWDTLLSDIRSSEVHHHRRKIGVVFQDYKLLHDLNVWENIALALSIIGAPTNEIESRVTDLLKLVNLVDKAFLFPNQLSGGEAQRVSIARALSTAPKVIFADEPTGNLDPETSRSIIHLLKKINELGTTILITTHDPVVIETLDASRHIKLNQGKLVSDSGAKKVKSKAATVDAADTADTDDAKPAKTQTKASSKPAHISVEVSSLDEDEDEIEDNEKNAKENTQKTETTSEKTKPKKRITIGIPAFITLPFGKKPKKNDSSKKESDHA